MATKQKIKAFDAVKMMRDVRIQISKETENMTLEQLKIYIAEKIQDSPLKNVGR